MLYTILCVFIWNVYSLLAGSSCNDHSDDHNGRKTPTLIGPRLLRLGETGIWTCMSDCFKVDIPIKPEGLTVYKTFIIQRRTAILIWTPNSTQHAGLQNITCKADCNNRSSSTSIQVNVTDLDVKNSSNWMNVGSCSVHCGGGIQSQVRLMKVPYYNGTLYEMRNTTYCNKEPCRIYKWSKLKDKNMTKQELQEEMKGELEELKAKIKISKKNTTSSLRRQISAPDERTSSTYMGYVGATVIASIFLSIILSDLLMRCRGQNEKNANRKSNKVHPMTD